jgi:hypothetical protein
VVQKEYYILDRCSSILGLIGYKLYKNSTDNRLGYAFYFGTGAETCQESSRLSVSYFVEGVCGSVDGDVYEFNNIENTPEITKVTGGNSPTPSSSSSGLTIHFYVVMSLVMMVISNF